jgi:DNA-binding CsgD family transcriptional regulator
MSINYPLSLNAALCGNDALKLLEIINRSLGCVSKNDVAQLFKSIQTLCAFDFALALSGRIQSDRFVPNDALENSFPDDFQHTYGSNNYLGTDALVTESVLTQKLRYWPGDWATLSQRQEIVSLCLDTDVKTGFIHVSKPAAFTMKASLITFAARSMPKDKRTEAIIDLVVPHLHIALSHIQNKISSTNQGSDLSRREIEVLNWLKLGKSSWDISIILGISERTVNFHIYNMMQKLGVVNRPQAVATALHFGLIDVD